MFFRNENLLAASSPVSLAVARKAINKSPRVQETCSCCSEPESPGRLLSCELWPSPCRDDEQESKSSGAVFLLLRNQNLLASSSPVSVGGRPAKTINKRPKSSGAVFPLLRNQNLLASSSPVSVGGRPAKTINKSAKSSGACSCCCGTRISWSPPLL